MALLERHYGDMQDMEFTVERGQLYMLQTRTRQADRAAALRIACDMVAEGVIDRDAAVTQGRCQPARARAAAHGQSARRRIR